jgi:hypothetical protein
MTTPDPADPIRDESPTTAVDPPPTPPMPPSQPSADASPPAGAAPWDVPAQTSAPPSWATSAGPPPQPQPQPQPQPKTQTQPGLVAGVVLVVIGVVVLLIRLVDTTLGSSSWPLWIIVPGLAMLIGSLAIPPRGGLGLAIPGTIIAIVGGILWIQDAYGLYGTWAYAWALVAPTAPGLAMLIYGLARGDRELAADGLRTTLVGIGLFLGFALFFEGVVGISGHRIANLDEVLPYVVIGFGALLVVASLFTGRRDRRDQGGTGGA